MPKPALNIKHPEAYQLAAEIARATGKSLTRVVVDALRAEKTRLLPRTINMEAVRYSLSILHAGRNVDNRNMDEVLYDDMGLPR